MKEQRSFVTMLSEAEFFEALLSFEHTAFRLELQRSYAEPHEAPQFAAFLRGDPQPGPDDPDLRDWYKSVAEHVARGGRVERVRVQAEPPTDYQRFERHLDRWNIAAGEVMRYMTRDAARGRKRRLVVGRFSAADRDAVR